MNLLTRLYLCWRNRPDSTLYTTGYRYTYAGHDQAKGEAARVRIIQAVQADQRSQPLTHQPPAPHVKPKPRKNVVDISQRRA